MKVVHVVEALDDSYGGPAKSIPYLAHYCRQRGIEPYLLSTRFTCEDANEVIAQKSLPWESFEIIGPTKLRYSPSLRKRLVEICASPHSSTVVHVHNIWNYTSYAAYKVCKDHGVPVIISPRGSLFAWSLAQGALRKSLALALFQKKALNAAYLHTTSKDEARTVSALGFGKKVFCIRNGVELANKRKSNVDPMVAAQRLGLDPTVRYALFMSRIHKKKGLELLLQAWSDCKKRYPWHLLIAGDAEDFSYLRALEAKVSSLDLEDSVSFIGFANAERKRLLFAASSFFVLPSFSENFGIVIAESLAAGLPVITTTGTPWAEIASEDAGWYIDMNHLSLVSALNDAMQSSPRKLERMGENGRRVAARYEWPSICEEMTEMYLRIIDETKYSA